MPMDDYECESCSLTFERFTHRRDERDRVTCPKCQSATHRIFTTVNIIPDTVPGGFDIENLDRHVRHFESKSQYRDELKARGLGIRDRHIQTVDGSDKNPNAPRWGGIDPYTMKAAEELILRVHPNLPILKAATDAE